MFNVLSIDKLNNICADSSCTLCCLALWCCDNYYFQVKVSLFPSFRRYHPPYELWILSKTYRSPLEKLLWPSLSFRSVSEQFRVLVENNSVRPCNYVWIYNTSAQGVYLKKSQNLRMAEVGRDLWRSTSQTPLLREWSIRACFPRAMLEHNFSFISLVLNDWLSQLNVLSLYYILLCNYGIIWQSFVASYQESGILLCILHLAL